MNRVIFTFGLFTLTAVVGCGGPAPSPVKGSVTYNGKGVPDVNVVLIGKDDARATAITDASGNFSSMTSFKDGDGAVPGDYTAIISRKTTVTENPTAEEYAVPDETKQPFPPKYSAVDVSDLKVTIKPGANDLKLELKD
jgi:hypothetical protein